MPDQICETCKKPKCGSEKPCVMGAFKSGQEHQKKFCHGHSPSPKDVEEAEEEQRKKCEQIIAKSFKPCLDHYYAGCVGCELGTFQRYIELNESRFSRARQEAARETWEKAAKTLDIALSSALIVKAGQEKTTGKEMWEFFKTSFRTAILTAAAQDGHKIE